MVSRLLVVGIVFMTFSTFFFLGAWRASRFKEEDRKALYLRGYNNGYEARSIDADKTIVARSLLSEKESDSAQRFINREHCTTIDRENIRSVLRRLL